MSCARPGAALATLLGCSFFAGVAWAQTARINEVSALLVFPVVLNESDASGPTRQTFLTVINTGGSAQGVRVFLVDGTGCAWCEAVDLSLIGSDTETLRIARNFATGNTEITALDGATTGVCPGANGFAVAVVYDTATGFTSSDNVLAGSSIVRDEASGSSESIEPIGFMTVGPGDGDLNLEFDGDEYARFPRIVADTVLAPDSAGPLEATLSLFTLNFNRGTPPLTECTITGTDETGAVTVATFQFGCWTHVALEAIDAEFGYPGWGPGGGSELNFMTLDCQVDVDGDSTVDAMGAVHGAVSQRAPAGARLRRGDPTSPVLAAEAAWGRPLVQSLTTGDATRISFEICNGVDDDLDTTIDEGCDIDGDGYCVAPSEFGGNQCPFAGSDCNEADATVRPGAAEINDGQDNQCPGDPGFGLTDELSGPVQFSVPGDKSTLCWPAQQGASAYQVARAFAPDFPTNDCFFAQAPFNCVTDFQQPSPGQTFHYLVRPLLPNAGSWGADSFGERTGVCQ